MEYLNTCLTDTSLWVKLPLLLLWLLFVSGSTTKHVPQVPDKLPSRTSNNISKNGRSIMMVNFTKKKILVGLVNLTNLPDQNIAQYVKCVFPSTIITVSGIFFVMQD